MTLKIFLLESAKEIREFPSIKRFMELRYDIMRKQFPHKTFSVGQASLDFFENAFAHISGLPFETSKEEPSEYELNYRNWILKHKEKQA